MAQKVLKGHEFQKMVEDGERAIIGGNKIILSGCGATGRLSILLESMWRCFFRDIRLKDPGIYNKSKAFEDTLFSIMTGGDYALIRSVEYFEDYEEFGRQQVREMGVVPGDILIAITEGGETSSVLGSVEEAADRGAKTFLLFNNPRDILCKNIERSRKVIEDPRVTILDLYCGPMALAGSTRMQATTSEQLIAGAALEIILTRILKQILSKDELKRLNVYEIDYADSFSCLLDELSEEMNVKTISEIINVEKNVYSEKGLVTYFADAFLLDIFTDTTERAPTFMIPPFIKFDDNVSPPSWAFVKNPLFETNGAWERVLGRQPRCLDWDSKLYREMGVTNSLADSPPQLDRTQILKFHIGNEEDNLRWSRTPNMAVSIVGSREIDSSSYKEYEWAFKNCSTRFMSRYNLVIGDTDKATDFKISCSPGNSVLNLMDHMAFKLVLNTISTGTMVLMGRVTGNWMSWVEVSNKKLRDRGIRLISEICGMSYEDSCYALHETLDELKTMDLHNQEKLSPVQYTIRKISEKTGKRI
ncbi:MAG: hypothetical protein M9904_01380 [Chitinophagaceae bacterium]|nr:hypothetical protein [Chitinophagaceae bacterium]